MMACRQVYRKLHEGRERGYVPVSMSLALILEEEEAAEIHAAKRNRRSAC